MTWRVIVGLLLGATLSPVAGADAWTLWTRYDVTRMYSNKAPEASERWHLDQGSLTFEECSAGKERIWKRVVSEYDDLTRYPTIANVTSIQGEAVFVNLRREGALVDGRQNQHFHCLADGFDPRH